GPRERARRTRPAPHRRGRVQGVRTRVPSGEVPRPAGRRRTVDQGRALMASERPLVAVLDYGSGNVHSAVKALEKAGADVRLTRDRALVAEADGLLVPGVGAFSAVMQQLESIRGSELIERRLAGGRPVMGICVGMQVMFESGIE